MPRAPGWRGERYALAHLAALRAAAAVLAARTRPRSRQGRPMSAWRLLTDVAPELNEWSAFFAAGAAKRAAAEAGRPVVSQREADDLIRDAEQFLLVVTGLLGLVQQPSLGLESLGLESPSLGSPSLGSPSLGSPSLGSPSLGSPSLGFPGSDESLPVPFAAPLSA